MATAAFPAVVTDATLWCPLNGWILADAKGACTGCAAADHDTAGDLRP